MEISNIWMQWKLLHANLIVNIFVISIKIMFLLLIKPNYQRFDENYNTKKVHFHHKS